MFCYVDDINSYATNEVAINWNSALAWVASFLADQGDGRRRPAAHLPGGLHQLRHLAGRHGLHRPARPSRTPAPPPVNGWTARFAFTGDQRLREAWLAKATQAGATVTARNESYNARIHPGATVMFGFNATQSSSYANPAPGLVTVNGSRCSS